MTAFALPPGLARALLRAALPTVLAVAGSAVAQSPASQSPPVDVSPAEKRLFVDNHFRDLRGATALDYVYERRGDLEPPITDSARVAVGAADKEGLRSVQVEYLHGEHQLKLPSPGRVEGNPVILFFLEREVKEMKRRTGGSELYFRKRMRMALAESAEVRPVRRTVGGREVDAQEIRIAPFRNDPMRARYEQLADKTYVLTLSEAVPGQVIELSTELAKPGSGGLLLSEKLSYKAAN